MKANFDLEDFLPYRLFVASEAASQSFREIYQREYQISRTEWRVLAHLGQYGDQTATEIGQRARLHKTKISRAVYGLERRRWLNRKTDERDRRVHTLSLTKSGQHTYKTLGKFGTHLNQQLAKQLGVKNTQLLLKLLRQLE